jgi:hypothetical protein
MGQQFGRRSWAEPWKIKMVEPLRMISREEREKAAAEAGYNTFLMRSADVYIDLLTDSGTSAMSQEQRAAMEVGDEAYAGSRSFFRLEAAMREKVGLIAMASSGKGRAREFLLGSTSIGILRSSTTPVLINKFEVVERGGRTVVAPACRLIFRKALVPVDFSSCTATCMDLIPKLSRFGLRESVLFHVVESSKANMDDEAKFKMVMDEVKTKLDGLKMELVRQGCEASTHVISARSRTTYSKPPGSWKQRSSYSGRTARACCGR